MRGTGPALALLLAGCEASLSNAQAPSTTSVAETPAAPATSAKAVSVDEGFVPLDPALVDTADTLDTLRARLGADQVIASRVPGAEGAEFDGWQLYPHDPARRIHVYLDDATGRPPMLRLLDRESRWQRADGIRMGRTLAELAARNGAPVGFTGFDWDYGGSCCDWNGGTLERDPPTGGMTLCPPQVDAVADPDYPMGDAQFDSNHPWVVAHPPMVCEFSLVLEPHP